MKTAVLLINLGTPDSPSTRDVRRYLTEFLNDPYVIDRPPLQRFLLVNCVIVPFRSGKSAAAYKKIWSASGGSPLLYHGLQLKQKVQQELGNDFIVELGMRYGKPSIRTAIGLLMEQKPERLVVLSLYPQFAMSTTVSSIEKTKEALKNYPRFKEVKFIEKFYEDPRFLDAWAERGKAYDAGSADHVLFSFHGLPEKHLIKEHRGGTCENAGCRKEITLTNSTCYRAGCYYTAKEIARRLSIPPEKYTISFQSRLGKEIWMKPYTDETAISLAQQGVKKLLVFSPSFVADCLETRYELGIELPHIFRENGGSTVTVVESLNTHPSWVKAVADLVIGYLLNT